MINNYFSIAGLCIGLINLGLALLISFFGKNKLHKVWSYVNYSISFWGFSMFVSGSTTDHDTAFLGWKMFTVGIILIALFYYHVIYIFCNLKSSRFLIFGYFESLVFIILTVFTNWMFGDRVFFSFHQIYYFRTNLLYNFFMFIWSVIVGKSFYELYQYIKNSKGISNIQAKYLFVAMIFGFGGGMNTAPAAWGLNIYPYGQILVCVYGALATYAIFRYRLMDVRLVVSNTAIFIGVYAFVLGIPFIFGYKYHLWEVAIWAMLVLATFGPFAYLYIQRRAEDRLLQEQRRYQSTLRRASAGMGRIKDLNKLCGMIVYILIRAIQIEHALIYIYDEARQEYVLGASKRKSGKGQFIDTIAKSSPLLEYLLNNKSFIVYEEFKQRALDLKDPLLVQITQIIASFEGALVVPIFIDKNLTAIIFMGKKESGMSYTEDDLAVFSILANQAALAIENAKFYEDVRLTHQQLFQAEKMATIGTMADGLSHQINNRFHALGFIAGDALDTIHLNQNEPMPDKMKDVMTELERAFVRVQENVVQGGEIVQGLLKYTRKGEAGFSAVDIQSVFNSALEMAQFKIKSDLLKVVHDYDPMTIPKVKGNFTQLQEVFFNLIDNSYDAMVQRKNESNEPDYRPTLMVRVFKQDGYAEIAFEDNGMGVKDEDMHKLFTPFFTTKLSSKRGTGLGLYVIKKIVEENHGGRVEMVSKFMQGTKIKLFLPVAIG
ncbi:MAG: GAF domain-containing protein [Candidatus Omnitrophica bacterium]|nr:GAF domain-containing protein [Candidatus Omnitrophota bacterium]